MRTIASAFFAVALSAGAWAQSAPQAKPTPQTPNEPGVQHPLPLPKQSPEPLPPDVRQPDVRNPSVRSPVTGTGRERPVSGNKKGATNKDSAAPATSPKTNGNASGKPSPKPAPSARP